jgi:hypothetical protein
VLEFELHLAVFLDEVLGAQEVAVARGELGVKVVPEGAFVDVGLDARAQGGVVGDDALDLFVDGAGR